MIFIAYIYKCNLTYLVTLTANPTRETKHQIGMALLSCMLMWFVDCLHIPSYSTPMMPAYTGVRSYEVRAFSFCWYCHTFTSC